jgi:hypothetical protein
LKIGGFAPDLSKMLEKLEERVSTAITASLNICNIEMQSLDAGSLLLPTANPMKNAWDDFYNDGNKYYSYHIFCAQSLPKARPGLAK